MEAAWAYQDYVRPLDLSDKWATNIKLLRVHVEEKAKKLAAKEEKLKANEVELVAKVEELEKAQAEVAQLGGELARSREAAAEVPSLRAQLEATQD